LRRRRKDRFRIVFGIWFDGLRPAEGLEFLVDFCNVRDVRLILGLNLEYRWFGGFHGSFGKN
jgi:hypothetical protein